MEFVHRPFVPGETIAAIATPPGEGGIAIVRIAGREALTVAERVFPGPVRSYKSHTAHFGRICTAEGKTIDEGILLVMLGKRSYTGEDTVELQCHGGMVASRLVLEAVLKAGARMASPGEFTFKAFMNGKLDLAQAEAVQRLIGARSEKAYEQASLQLTGVLSEKIGVFQSALTEVAAVLEAWVDFPEEGLEFATQEEMIASLQRTCDEMRALLATFHEGEKIQEGIALCIVGPPNAGKSSLMNALLRHERAIVTPIAGTTRDVLEADLMLGGFHFRLLDTAGIRSTEELIEKEGIRRSFEAIQRADLVLLVLDASCGVGPSEQQLLEAVPLEKTILVWNKIDLDDLKIEPLHFSRTVAISVKERQYLEELKQAINDVLWTRKPQKDEVMLTSLRHKEALCEAIACCERALEGLKGDISPEFLTFEVRSSLLALGKVVGINVTEDILSAIFSKFCVGK